MRMDESSDTCICIAGWSDSCGASWVRTQNKIIVSQILGGPGKQERIGIWDTMGKVSDKERGRLIKIHTSLPELKAITSLVF